MATFKRIPGGWALAAAPISPVSPFHIDEAGADEYPAVGAALLVAHAEYRDFLPLPLFTGYLVDLLDLEARAASSRLLVARRNGRVIGTATYYPDASRQGHGWPARWAAVRALAVVPQARGLGVAGRLLEACVQRALADGADAIAVHSASFMDAAGRLYGNLGFERRVEHDFQVPDPATGAPGPVTALTYVRPLRPEGRARLQVGQA